MWMKIIREYCLKTVVTIPKLCLYPKKFYDILNLKMSREFLVFLSVFEDLLFLTKTFVSKNIM